MWYSDDEYWDYSISINAIFNTSFSCVTQPNYHAYFVSWNVTVEWTAWQNTDSWEACYYSCIGWYSWDDCNIPPTPPDYSDCLSMTDENVENLNTTLWISQSREQWCKTEWISIDYTNNDFNWIPSEIWYLKKLKNLGLIWLGLSSLPEQFSYLTALTNLSLQLNDFTEVPVEVLMLDSLTSLSLSQNNITIVPSAIWNLTNLTYLDLGHNEFNYLPSEIWELSKLTSLRLDWVDELTSLPSNIKKLNKLTWLLLATNDDILWNLSHNFFSSSTSKICDIVWDNGDNICVQYIDDHLNITIEN